VFLFYTERVGGSNPSSPTTEEDPRHATPRYATGPRLLAHARVSLRPRVQGWHKPSSPRGSGKAGGSVFTTSVAFRTGS